MSVLELSIMLMLLLFAILGSGVWIALALAVCGFAAVLTKVATPAGQVLATSMWAASDSWTSPLFRCSSGWVKFCIAPNCQMTCSKAWRLGCKSCRGGCSM